MGHAHRRRNTEAAARSMALSAVLAALTLTACGERGGGDADGLQTVKPFGWHDSMDAGQRFTDGMLIIQNTTGEPIEIVKVEPEQTGDLKYLGSYLAGPNRTANLQQTHQYPPADPRYGTVEPAEGAVLQDGEAAAEAGYSLLLGYEVGDAERSTRTSVTVTYRQGGHVRTVTYPYTLAICVPRGVPCTAETSGW